MVLKQNNSTDDAITRVADVVTEIFKRGLEPLAIFLDSSKAFDAVAHQILLHRLDWLVLKKKH